jgi:hypothetical protein
VWAGACSRQRHCHNLRRAGCVCVHGGGGNDAATGLGALVVLHCVTRVHGMPVTRACCSHHNASADVHAVRFLVFARAGLKWDLDGHLMEMGGLVSTSNEIMASEVWVESDKDLIWTTQLHC